MFELQRLLSLKRLIMLLMIAVVNLALFAGFCRTQREEQISYWESMRMWGVDTVANDREKMKKYLETDYYTYLEYVQSQSGSQSILGKLTEQSGFVDRNNAKTAEDYQGLNGVQLENGENRGLLAVTDYDVTDYLLLIAPLLLVLEMIADADTAVGALTRSTKRGRLPLCAWRVAALVILSAASVLLLYGGNILYTIQYYGSPGFSRAIQSIPEFQLCPLRLSIGGYFFAVGCLKVMALTIISLFVWLMLARFYAVLGWTLSGVTLGSAFLLHKLVLPTSNINHLKFLNVFSALEADIFFTQYCNLNWFGYPSGFRENMLSLMAALLLVLTVLCLVLIGWARPGKVGQHMELWKDRMAKRMTKHLPRHTLFGFEGWKLLIAQKAFLVLAVCGVMGFTLWQDIHLYAPVNSSTESFYRQYGGEVTEDKIKKAAKITESRVDAIKKARIRLAHAYLNEESEYEIRRIQGRITEYTDELSLYKSLLNAMLSLTRYTHETGNPAWLVQQNAYQLQFGENAAERRCCMVLLLYLIFAFSGIRAYDNRYDTRMLLRSTKRGRAGLFTAQTVWCMLLTLIAVVGLHGIYLIRLAQDVGFFMPEAPAQSLEMFRWIPFPVTLRTCIIFHMILRYLAAMLVVAGITAISRFSKTPQKALLLAMVVLLLPAALAESGIEQFRSLDLVHYLTCCARDLL